MSMLASLNELGVSSPREAGTLQRVATRFEELRFKHALDLAGADAEFFDSDVSLDGKTRHLAKRCIEAATQSKYFRTLRASVAASSYIFADMFRRLSAAPMDVAVCTGSGAVQSVRLPRHHFVFAQV